MFVLICWIVDLWSDVGLEFPGYSGIYVSKDNDANDDGDDDDSDVDVKSMHLSIDQVIRCKRS